MARRGNRPRPAPPPKPAVTPAPAGGAYRPLSDVDRDRIVEHALEMLEATKARNLLIGKGGLYGNVIRLAPMLNVTEAEIDEGIDALRTAAASIA